MSIAASPGPCVVYRAIASDALAAASQLLADVQRFGLKIIEFRIVVPTANQIRAYWWCSPPRIGRQTMRPTISAARDMGASLLNDK